jgi:hypothetical protein
MRSITREIAAATALLLLLSVGACGKKDDAAVNDTISLGPTPDSRPIRVSDVELGRRIGIDKKINDQTDDFAVRDTIYVSVATEGASTGSTLKAKWTFNDKQVVDSSSLSISPAGGTTVREFHITKKSPWPKGKYKVEIFLDGVSAGTKDFEVK